LNSYLAGTAFALFVAFLIFAYRWMDSVKDNHLTHIQAAVESTALHSAETAQQLRDLAIREEARHTLEMRANEELKDLIRRVGL